MLQAMATLLESRTQSQSMDCRRGRLPEEQIIGVYSVLKRQTLEIPIDAPSCCTTAIGDSKRAEKLQKKSHMSDDSVDLLSQYLEDNISDDNIPHQPNDDADKSCSFSPLDINNPLQSFETDMRSISSNAELLSHDFSQGNLEFGPIDPICDYDFDYNIQMDDAFADQHHYTRQTEPVPNAATDGFVQHNKYFDNGKRSSAPRPSAHQSHFHKPSNTQWAPSFLDQDALPDSPTSQQEGRKQQQQQQQETPALTPASTPSNPLSPSWQTTIRFSEADPSIVSTVIGILAKSQAKFIYETH
ncbi:MAG: hypothetical protein Q9169_007891 [Polycauliona sp. 2 TL-2023]